MWNASLGDLPACGTLWKKYIAWTMNHADFKICALLTNGIFETRSLTKMMEFVIERNGKKGLRWLKRKM
jgi:hypothetical protein